MSGRIDQSKWVERREWVRQQQASGLSVAEFCREHGLHVGNFYAWKHKLAGELQGQSQSVASRNPWLASQALASQALVESLSRASRWLAIGPCEPSCKYHFRRRIVLQVQREEW